MCLFFELVVTFFSCFSPLIDELNQNFEMCHFIYVWKSWLYLLKNCPWSQNTAFCNISTIIKIQRNWNFSLPNPGFTSCFFFKCISNLHVTQALGFKHFLKLCHPYTLIWSSNYSSPVTVSQSLHNDYVT